MAGEREEMRGRVLDVKDLAAYQEGAVASRTVVLKKAGTITAFAFDTGEGLPEHTAPFDAIVQGLEGEAEVTIGGKPLRLGEGQMVIMPAGVPHAVKALSRFRMLLTMIHE
ncbi:MAG: cupin domain-containing protein [Methanomicrobiales archaeon]|nr:cupin domain-containing protein [Methanomicrobiales archaeon]